MQSVLLTVAAFVLSQAVRTPPDLRTEDGPHRRARLQLELATRPACTLDQTSHYFVVGATAERVVVLELERRAEGVRAWLEATLADWPAVSCCPGPPGSGSMRAMSTIRFFASSIDYRAAGGRDGTTSTYLPSATELLLRPDKGVDGRKRLWRDLQAGIVAGYLDVRGGGELQAPWFARGLELVCAPFGTRDGRVDARPDRDRLALAKDLLDHNEFVALDELTTTSAKALDESRELQAELWSLAWFLQRRHPKLLQRYFDQSLVEHDPDAATK